MRPLCLLLCSTLLLAQSLDQKAAQANSLLESGRFPEALALYEDLFRQVKPSLGLYMNLGIAAHMSGQDPKAIPAFEAALKIKPDIPQAWLFLGTSYLRVGAPQKALPLLKKAQQANPSDSTRNLILEAAIGSGDFAFVATELRQLLEKNPSNTRYWFSLARAYEALADTDLAKLDRLAPQTGYWFAAMAESRKRNQQRAAFLLYREALKANPKLRGVHAGLARIYDNAGKQDWAAIERQREQALGTPQCPAPTASFECRYLHPQARLKFPGGATPAELFWRIRSYRALAEEAYAKLADFPESLEYLRHEAGQRRLAQNNAEALRLYEKALVLAPQDRNLRLQHADTLAANRNFDAALAAVDAILRDTFESPDALLLRGQILIAAQRPADAIEPLQKALQLDSGYLPASAELGRALVAAGRAKEAVTPLQAALSIDSDGSLYFQLSRAYSAAGLTAKSKLMLAEYEKRRLSDEATELTAP